MRAKAQYTSGSSISLQKEERFLLDEDLNLFTDLSSPKKPIAVIEFEGGDFSLFKIEEEPHLFINEKKVDDSVLLKDGDQIRLGDLSFTFSLEPELIEEKEEKIDQIPYQLTPSEMNPMAPNDLEPSQKEDLELSKEKLHEEILDEPTFEEDRLAEIHFDLTASGRFLLKVIGGPNTGAEFSLEAPESGEKSYLIGTDPSSCDIVFHDNSVSRQHAKLYIGPEGKTDVEDLKSRNGTLVDGKSKEGRSPLTAASVVTLGTTSFVIYDRDGNMQTIISPLLPDIVKVLQRDEEKKIPAPLIHEEKVIEPPPPPKEKPVGAFLIATFITGFFVLAALGVSALFKDAPIEMTDQIPSDSQLKDALAPFTAVKYSFNKTTGQLLLVGNVLTDSEKNQLLYNLQGLKFIKNIDASGITIDELVWKNVNEVLNRYPAWRSVTIQSVAPGQFVLQGYLKTKKEAENLYEYITTNFPFLNRMERKITIDEEIGQSISSILESHDIHSIDVKYSAGEASLSGAVPQSKQEAFKTALQEIKQIQGIRLVRNATTLTTQELSTVNISDRYEVSGFAKKGTKISVIINGRIVSVGDSMDGMNIRSIEPNTIFLEKGGVNYRIDYRQP